MMAAISIGLLTGGYIVLFVCVIRLIRKYRVLYDWVSNLSIDLQLQESDYNALSNFCMKHISHE